MKKKNLLPKQSAFENFIANLGVTNSLLIAFLLNVILFYLFGLSFDISIRISFSLFNGFMMYLALRSQEGDNKLFFWFMASMGLLVVLGNIFFNFRFDYDS